MMTIMTSISQRYKVLQGSEIACSQAQPAAAVPGWSRQRHSQLSAAGITMMWQ